MQEITVETVKLSTKGQLVIPKELREAHHLAVGTEFVVSFVGDEIRLTPLPMFPRATVAHAAGLLARRGRNGPSEEQSRASISKTLKARDAVTRS
jgi:AbrB family looped-hinge helix DNA binding protein